MISKTQIETETSATGANPKTDSKTISKPIAVAKAKPDASSETSANVKTATNRVAANVQVATPTKTAPTKTAPTKTAPTKTAKQKTATSPSSGENTMAKKPTKTITKASKNGAGKPAAKSGRKSKKEGSPVDVMLKENEHLSNAVQQIEKQFGDGAIMALGNDSCSQIRGISTGSLSLDIALGGQGLPCGRIIEIYGPESSGKTTLALHTIAEAQKSGGIAAFVDAEHAFDPSWAKKLGVQLDTLLVSQPSSGEEAMQITEMLIKSNSVDVIVVDSVAALVPRQELEGEIGDAHVGLQARLMSQSMRKLTGAISKSKTCVIFINQIREKIGVMFGSPETTPGGRALKFYTSVRVDVRRIGQLKDGEDVVGQRVRTKIVKNKVAPPFRIAEFDMMHTNGISYEGDLIDLGVAHKVVTRSGSWFKYGTTHIGQGKEKARNYLIERPELAEEIRGKILAQGGYIDDIEVAAEEAEAPADS